MQITRNRTERKIKEKMLVTSEEGLVQLAKKRASKMQKKKLKHKERVLMNALSRWVFNFCSGLFVRSTLIKFICNR